MRRSFVIFLVSLIFVTVARFAPAAGLPVAGGTVTSRTGWRVDPFGSGKMVFHRGIDIAVPEGTPVRPTEPGRVVFSGTRQGYGLTVIVAHPSGRETVYGHNAILRVAAGVAVTMATVIALSGNTGRSTGPHVHYEVRGRGEPGDAALPAAEVPSIRPARPADGVEAMQEIAENVRASIYAFRPVGEPGS